MRKPSLYNVRKLASSDFDALMKMEEEIFAQGGESVLGPYYVRLCCEFFTETCFIAYAGDRPAGYILCFINSRDAYCTTLAVHPDYQGTRITVLLLRALVQALMDRVDHCWFTVKEDNGAARTLHAVLGAEEVGVRKNFYGPGDERILACI